MENIQLRVGVIGLGIGKSHAKGVQATEGALLYALCDTDEKKLQSLARELNVANTFTDYRDLIADPNVDAVIIASPDQDHRKMILDTLDAGKHILCEKSFTVNADQAKEVARLAKEKNLFVMEALWVRFHQPTVDAIAKAKAEVPDIPEVREFLTFIETSKRGVLSGDHHGRRS
jgi:predicted dehydrogenase